MSRRMWSRRAFATGERAQSEMVFADLWPLQSWPDVPTRFLLCRDDRFFPAESSSAVSSPIALT